MSMTILYRNPARPNEARMTMIMGQENAEATVDQLEERGFVVEKITFAPASKSVQAESDTSPGRLPQGKPSVRY